jgi:hypothetical protein
MLSNTNNPIALRSVSVNVTTSDVQFVFRNYPRTGRPYFGGLYVDLAQAIPTGTTATLPIVFTSEGGNPTPVVGLDGEAITVASITGTGIYHLFYDQRNNRLQLLSPYIV